MSLEGNGNHRLLQLAMAVIIVAQTYTLNVNLIRGRKNKNHELKEAKSSMEVHSFVIISCGFVTNSAFTLNSHLI